MIQTKNKTESLKNGPAMLTRKFPLGQKYGLTDQRLKNRYK